MYLGCDTKAEAGQRGSISALKELQDRRGDKQRQKVRDKGEKFREIDRNIERGTVLKNSYVMCTDCMEDLTSDYSSFQKQDKYARKLRTKTRGIR